MPKRKTRTVYRTKTVVRNKTKRVLVQNYPATTTQLSFQPMPGQSQLKPSSQSKIGAFGMKLNELAGKARSAAENYQKGRTERLQSQTSRAKAEIARLNAQAKLARLQQRQRELQTGSSNGGMFGGGSGFGSPQVNNSERKKRDKYLQDLLR